MVYDTTVVLSCDFNKDGTLSEECKRRVDLAVDEYLRGNTSTLTMSGRKSFKEILLFPQTHAGEMRNYAVNMQVPPNRVFVEDLSLETVGQAVFTKLRVVKPKRFKKMQVISSDYHEKRVLQIFQSLYEPEFSIDFNGVNTGLLNNADVKERENKSLETFLRTFEGVKAEDDHGILQTLFWKHQIYRTLRGEIAVYNGFNFLKPHWEI